MLTEDYCDFETAKLLKEKGFDEKCQKVYMHNGQLLWAQIFMEGESFVNNECIDLVAKYNNWAGSDYAFLCPTLQMAMKWLREVHKIHIIAEPCLGEGSEPNLCFNRWFWTILKEEGEYKPIRKIDEFPTYEKACEAAIKCCLENLI